MQYTENYSLKLPGYGDNADVGDLNDNTTAIDALIHANRQIEAPAFSTATAYTAGDMCVYENVLYKFTSDKAAGNWDSTKVTATNLADEVTDAAQSGGTNVEANPVEAATADLHKLKVDTTVYGIPDPTVTKTATGNPIEFTDGADAPLVKCVTQITGYQSGSGTPSPDNVRPIVAYSSGTIEVEDGEGNTTTHTTTYPSAIYRGSEDVVNGVETHDMVKVVFDGSESWLANPTRKGFYLYVSQMKSGKFMEGYANYLNTLYADNTGDITGIIFGISNSYIFVTGVYDIAGSTVADWKTYLSNNNLEVAYELATPTTSSVTPTNFPIKSLSGYNHIESSTGDMEVEYITDTYQPLVDLIDDAAKQREAYSTDEQEIGTWVDGSKLYQKTYTLSGTGAANPYSTTVDMTGKTITNVIPHYAKYTYNGGTVGYCVGSRLTANNSNVLTVQYNDEAPPTLDVIANLGGSTETYEVCFTLQYVKTSSNNRSLSTLSKGPSEESVDKVDKVDKVDEPTETIEVKEENAGESNSENER